MLTEKKKLPPMLARLKKKGKLKKEDILKYGTKEEIETLNEVRSLYKKRPYSPDFETKTKLNKIMFLLADMDEASLEKIKKEVDFLLALSEHEKNKNNFATKDADDLHRLRRQIGKEDENLRLLRRRIEKDTDNLQKRGK